MNKQLMIIGGAVVIALLALGAFMVLGKSANAPSQVTEVANQAEQEDSSKASIKSLLGMGKNQTCTVNMPAGEGNSEGTVYVSGKNMRMDFTTIAGGSNIEGHMIQDGEFMYSWSSAANQGTKIKISELAMPAGSPSTSQVDLDQEIDVNCSDWSVDNSKFTPPADVTFVDFTSTLKQTQTQSPGMQTKPNTSMCDQITDPQAKAACLQYVR